MTKNFIYIVFIGIIGMIMFQACQEDPTFPDPGFEIGDQRVEVRRDTADFYNINIAMDVPNGVKVIELLDAIDFNLLDEIHEYDGKKNFNFDYPVDLRSFEKDTVLNYIVKVTDNDERSFNQGIRIQVRRLSYPEILLVGGTNLAVAAPAYVVKGIVSAGLNPIESIQILYEGEEQFYYEPATDTTIYEMPLKELVFLGNMEPDRDYHIDIVISDKVGQKSTTTISLHKTNEIKRPLRINYTNKDNRVMKMKLYYDEVTGDMTGLDYVFSHGVNYYHGFSYNDLGMVDTLTTRTISADGTFSYEKKTYYNYIPDTKQLSSIETQGFDYEDGQVTGVEDKKLEYQNFIYSESGIVTSFYKTQTVSEIYYSDPFDLGENVFGEFWQTTYYQSSSTFYRQHREDYDPVLVPTFIEGFAPFYSPINVLLDVFNDLFWHKYMMTKTVPSDDAYSYTSLKEPSYTYETDTDGNITRITKTFLQGGWKFKGKSETYSFFYD